VALSLGLLRGTPSLWVRNLIGGSALTAGSVHTHTHFTDTILRAGPSYQFH